MLSKELLEAEIANAEKMVEEIEKSLAINIFVLNVWKEELKKCT